MSPLTAKDFISFILIIIASKERDYIVSLTKKKKQKKKQKTKKQKKHISWYYFKLPSQTGFYDFYIFGDYNINLAGKDKCILNNQNETRKLFKDFLPKLKNTMRTAWCVIFTKWYTAHLTYNISTLIGNILTNNISQPCVIGSAVYAVFISNTFISNARLKLSKNQTKAKQHLDVKL